MDYSVHNKLVSFIWSIADDCLRDAYVRGKYHDVILPMVVLRRLDTLLEPSKQADSIDELLDSVDLSSYGLERDRLGQSIGLDSSETELDPQNPNTRGGHGTESEENPLDEIIRTFNERWFQDWSATPEEQRVKFISVKVGVSNHPEFEDKYLNDADPQNRNLALNKIVKEVMLNKRKDDMEMYRLFFGDDAFRSALVKSLENSFLKA